MARARPIIGEDGPYDRPAHALQPEHVARRHPHF
jgi:hypothetical protein